MYVEEETEKSTCSTCCCCTIFWIIFFIVALLFLGLWAGGVFTSKEKDVPVKNDPARTPKQHNFPKRKPAKVTPKPSVKVEKLPTSIYSIPTLPPGRSETRKANIVRKPVLLLLSVRESVLLPRKPGNLKTLKAAALENNNS